MVHFLYELKRLNYYIFSLTKEQPLPTKSKQEPLSKALSLLQKPLENEYRK